MAVLVMGMEVTDLDMVLESTVHMGLVLVTVLVDTGSGDSMVLGLVVIMDNLNIPVRRMLSNQLTKLQRKPTYNLKQRTLNPSKPMLRPNKLSHSLRQRLHKPNSHTL